MCLYQREQRDAGIVKRRGQDEQDMRREGVEERGYVWWRGREGKGQERQERERD